VQQMTPFVEKQH